MLRKQWFIHTFSDARSAMVTILLLCNILWIGLFYNQWKIAERDQRDMAQNQKLVGQGMEEVQAQCKAYYAQQLQKLLGEEDLVFLAQNRWRYVITLNGKVVEREIIYLEEPSAHIILAEFVEDKEILPEEILKKGTITGSDPKDFLQDHLRVITNAAYSTKVETSKQGRRVIYDFKDIPKGTIINLKPSVLLKERLSIGTKEAQWGSYIEVISR